jgi:riboflavin kinase/FMN adenylyltransferase
MNVAVAKAVREGDLAEAARLLGHPFEVHGRVIEGDRRGKLLGFPTANLEPAPGQVLPPMGIYAGAARGRRAAVSIGVNPHYGGTALRLEAHLLDFDGDLYGQQLVLELWTRIRDERAFGSEAELVEAIGADVEAARQAVRP